MNSALLISLTLLVPALPQDTTKPRSEHPPQIAELVAKLPECSSLRRQLEQGRFGDGIEKPYMRPMLDHGVQRAYFEVEGVWRHGRPEDVRIVRRLYYKQLDGPHAQITDVATLKEIGSSGLEEMLDQAVLARVKAAVLHAGIDRWAGLGRINYWQWQLSGSKISGAIDLFASGWLSPSRPDWMLPGTYRDSVANAASVGDVIDLSRLLSARKYAQPELKSALNSAVMSLWDNTAAIELLIRAGADVNATLSEGTTPLMLAYESSCNIPVLLEHGARVDARNKWGKTALDFARERHDAVAERLLEAAAATP